MTGTVRVGVGVFVLRSRNENPGNPQFLVGKRKGHHGAGTYGLPGGHLEFGETIEDCATREMMEETGLEIEHLGFLTATNDIMTADNKHYITMFVTSVRRDDKIEPKVLEPDKCEGWEWISWEELVDIANHVRGLSKSKEPPRLSLFTPLLSLVYQRPGTIPHVMV